MNVVAFRRPGDQVGKKLIEIDIDEQASPHRWYLIRSKTGQQRKAKFEIRRAGFRAVVIMAHVDKWHHRRKEMVPRRGPAFDNYIFVRLPARVPNWFRLMQCSAVEGVMTTTNAAGDVRPFSLQWKVIGRLLDKQRRGGFDFTEDGKRRRGEVVKSKREQQRDIFQPGRRLKITGGPFATFDGEVEKFDERTGHVDVLIQIFGRDTPLHFTDLRELEVVGPPPESELVRGKGPRAA